MSTPTPLATTLAGLCLLAMLPSAGNAQDLPAKLRDPAVVRGEGLLTKSLFLDQRSLGTVTDFHHNPLEPEQLGIAGLGEAVWTDLDGQVLSTVKITSRPAHLEFIDVDGDGAYEFLNRGGVGWQNASLLDENGNVLWSPPPLVGVNDMAGGDLNGDGIADFVVGYNGGGGVHRLERDGKTVWQQPDGNVWQVHIVDVDADGTPEIVHSNAAGEMIVRDGSGKIIRRATPASYFSSFSTCAWPTRMDHPKALVAGDDRIWLFDFNGEAAAEFDAPDCTKFGGARGTSLRLIADQPEHLAVLVEFSHWRRSILYIYDADAKLVYQEIFGERCPAIGTLPAAGTAVESLLIGASGKVWSYALDAE